MRQQSHPVLCVLALSFDCRQMYQKASCTVYLSSAGLTDFDYYIFAIPVVCCSQISTGSPSKGRRQDLEGGAAELSVAAEGAVAVSDGLGHGKPTKIA
jgi:hypothetical protein